MASWADESGDRILHTHTHENSRLEQSITCMRESNNNGHIKQTAATKRKVKEYIGL